MSIIRHHRVRATSSKYRRLPLRSTLRRSLHEQTYGIGMKRKDELLSTLKLIIHQYGPTHNRNSLTLNYLNCDSGSEQLEMNFLTYCRINNIYVNASAPYKHQQNFFECFVGAIKNGVRVALLYNKAPFYLWYHAMVYYIHTYNQVPRRNEMRSKDEHFYGIKPDVSINVPFYAVDMLIDRRRLELIKSIHLM